MFEELGMRSGTFIILMILVYYIIKWAVKNGIREAFNIEDPDLEKLEKYMDSKK